MADIWFRRFPAARRRAISERMSSNAIKGVRQPVRRAEGLPGGCAAMPVLAWPLDPAQEVPGRRCPIPVLPPPRRSAARRILAALGSFGATIAGGFALMVLAQHLTMP